MPSPVHSPRPLQGIGVLVTRPQHQAEGLCRAIRDVGGEPIPFPVLAIAQPRDTDALQRVLAQLDRYHVAIFISPNAVTRALNLIGGAAGLPAHLTLAAVGKGSARELARFGCRVDLVPPGRADSEALLQQPQLQAEQVRGRRVLIVRGEGGRELLEETLTARGAEVEYAEVYRRVRPETDPAPVLKRWARGEVNIALVTSNEGLHNLFEMVGTLARHWLRRTPLIVVSERGKILAAELGFEEQVLVATSASDEGILDALIQWRQSAH